MQNLPRKLSISFLALSILVGATDGARAQDVPTLRLRTPLECLPAALNCSCFDEIATDKIAKGLQEREKLRFELDEYKKFSQGSITEKAWYEDDTLYYAALIGSVLVGGVVGYAVGSK
jgi:hypothetical protein